MNHKLEMEIIYEFPYTLPHAIWWMELAGYKVEKPCSLGLYTVYALTGQYVGRCNKSYIMECAEYIHQEYYELGCY